MYQATKMEEQNVNVRPGNAVTALQAISAIIDRQIKKQTIDGAIRTTAFTAKGISSLADGGIITTIAIGAVESIALLLNTLRDFVSDAEEMIAGNKLIAEDKIDIELFNVCPILGCYYVAVQDHSTIMNFEITDIGKDNWKQDALRLRYALDPVIQKASNLIKASIIEIPNWEQAKGIYQSTFLQKIELASNKF